MRAANGERDLVRADVGHKKRRRRTGPVRCAETACLDRCGKRRAEPVTTGGRQEGDASWTAVGASPRPNRDAAHVEQIDEVGVGTEPRVRADRIGGDFSHRDEGRDGRHAEHVDLCKLLFAGTGERLQPICALECVDGGELQAGFENGARGRMQRIGRLGQTGADGSDALGYPRAFIEHAGDGVERLEIHLDNRRADCPQLLQRRVEVICLDGVAEGLQRCGVGNADSQRRWRRSKARLGQLSGICVVGIEAGGRVENLPNIGHCHGEDGDRVQRAARRHHAGGRKRAERRLQPDNAVQRRRHPAGARRIGAEGKGSDAARNRDRRARRGATRHDIRIERIARDRIGRAHADEAGRKLVEIGLAEADRAGFLQLCYHKRVGLGGVGKVRAGGGGRHAGDVDIVLDREGNAPERPAVRLAERDRLRPAPVSRASWMKMPGSAAASRRLNASAMTSSGRVPCA